MEVDVGAEVTKEEVVGRGEVSALLGGWPLVCLPALAPDHSREKATPDFKESGSRGW